jgi:hypothetical protein
MNKHKIIVMDYATSEVHVYDYDTQIWGNSGEDFILTHYSEHGLTFTPENCKWMIVDTKEAEGRLPIYIH